MLRALSLALLLLTVLAPRPAPAGEPQDQQDKASQGGMGSKSSKIGKDTLFERYPSLGSPKDPKKPHVLWTQPMAKSYRTLVRKALQAPANFAGHYSVFQVGCGTDCQMGILIDRASGKISQIPIGAERGYEHCRSSRLILIDGRPYLFDGTNFEILAKKD